jgi:hypothetical protein
MSMGHWWNDTDRGKLRRKKLREEPVTVPLCPKSHVDWSEFKLSPRGNRTTNRLSQAGSLKLSKTILFLPHREHSLSPLQRPAS